MRKFILTYSLAAFFGMLGMASWGAKPEFHWEKMTVTQTLPSQVFARLGLTHFTRLGYTRDGHKKTDPDPTFPAGLTDVVPQDKEHILLVRGTTEGLAQFRARVTAMAEQIVTERWHLKLELLPKREGATDLGDPVEQDLPSERPTSVALGEVRGLHIYQFNVHVNPNGTLTLACRVGLPLPAPPATGAAPEVGVPAVLVPTLVWTNAATKTIPLGGTAVFDDLASGRQALRRRVGLPDEPTVTDGSTDYQIRVTVTSPVAAPEAPPVPGDAAH